MDGDLKEGFPQSNVSLSLTEQILYSQNNPFLGNKVKIPATPETKEKYLSLFGKFLYDPGLNRQYVIEEERFKKIRAVNPNFNTQIKNPVAILNRNAVISLARNYILAGDRNIAFVRFDIKNVRGADLAGYAENLLREAADIFLDVSQQSKSIDTDLTVVPARVGGDEFIFLVSSTNQINQQMLERLYEQAREKVESQIGYFSNEDQKEVQQEKLGLKDTKEEREKRFLIANSDEERKKILVKALHSGQIPEPQAMKQEEEVGQAEYEELKKQIERDQSACLEAKELGKRINAIEKKHPEYHEEMNEIRALIEKSATDPTLLPLASSLFFSLDNYITDPLFKQEVVRVADLIAHMGSREGQAKPGALIRVSVPWLKNFNSRYGYSKTDEFIGAIFSRIKTKEFIPKANIRDKTLIAREGGDFYILADQDPRINYSTILLGQDDTKMLSSLQDYFSAGLPIFISSSAIQAETQAVRQILNSLDGQNKMQLIGYFNDLFEENPEKGKKALDFYLEQRKEDRLRFFRYWIPTLLEKEEINKDFSKLIFKR